MSKILSLFKKSKQCDKKSDATTYYAKDGPCTFLSNKKGNCCEQVDIKFMTDVSEIYTSRSAGVDNAKLQDILSYVEEFHNFEHSSVYHVGIDMKKRKDSELLNLVQEFRPDIGINIFFTKSSGFIKLPSNLKRVVYVVDGIKNIELPFHKFTMIQQLGRDSSISFSDLPLFKNHIESPGFEDMVNNIRGLSFISIDAPFVFSQPTNDYYVISNIVGSLFDIGRSLISKKGENTKFTFSFRSETMTTRFIQILLRDDDSFEPVSFGVLSIEEEGDSKIKIEIRAERGRVICELSTTTVTVELPVLTRKKFRTQILNSEAMDIITFEDMSVRKYLQDDPKNMVLVESNNKPHFTNSDDLQTSMEEGIVYACKEANERLFQDAENVETELELFNSRRIGTLGGYIKADQLRSAMALSSNEGDSSTRLFYISGPLKQIPAVISKRVYDGYDDLVSANHCQVGAEGGLFEVLHITFV